MKPRLLVTSLLVLGLAACGSTSDPAQTSTPPSSDLGSVKKDDALAALLPPEIASAGTLKVGSNIQNPPNNFYDQDGKTPMGSEVDLIKAISAKLGLKAEHSDMAFSSLITSLETGRVDVTMAAMNDTAERQQKIDFVDYFTSGITIMVQKGNPQGVKGPDDLCGKGIAVNLGSSQEQFGKEQSAKCVAAGKPEVTLSVTDSDTGNQNQLRTGRVAAILNDLPTAVYVAKTAGDGQYFEVVPLAPINGGPYGIGVAKKNAKLSEAIKGALQSLIDDGTYEKIVTTWDIKQGAITKAAINGK
ncbi:amino acid ABC transporter substrate-binding protein, PAAT family [Lentzea waywayandensis]|uniref:Amino acid ABC transporter substrate-binding protein, PAAT family n=1 Tax=Lentzea waywayandensis TaxID=84724 RepID=A0A1I6F442_9PSEU|nr:ABC transporter substrate-binding protein [Lentzea waywayandensis]SFR24690.1 amino acid ABC transporter substrate-binding protein, PAAT family [Lentzea waywayandensis]